jgi:hypothetical protein
MENGKGGYETSKKALCERRECDANRTGGVHKSAWPHGFLISLSCGAQAVDVGVVKRALPLT